jgi:REP element-mobilizing transposase RayT
MARGDRREEIFRDDQDRLKFLGYLSEGAGRYRIKVHCYVLMENHFHLVVTTMEAKLSKWMHQLKTPVHRLLSIAGIGWLVICFRDDSRAR